MNEKMEKWKPIRGIGVFLALLFIVDLVIPDVLPFVDEIVLGVGSAAALSVSSVMKGRNAEGNKKLLR